MKKKIFGLAGILCFAFVACFMFGGCDMAGSVFAGKDMTLAEALSTVSDGGTIVLDSNITLDSQIVINKKVTIDLGGFAINNTEDIWNDTEGVKTWSLISVQQGGNLTIKNGSLLPKENDCYAIDVRDGAEVTIVDGNYVGNVTVVYVHTGSALINGGNFKLLQLDNNHNDTRHLLNCLDANYQNQTANITVKGGTYENYDPSNNQSLEQDFVAEGYTVTDSESNGKTYYTVNQG